MANDDDRLAQRARTLHGASLEALSPRVRAQLRLRAQATALAAAGPGRRGRDWRWLAAPALALALAFSLPRSGPKAPGDAPAAGELAAAANPPVVPLEQDPEFYAWLASADALALASE